MAADIQNGISLTTVENDDVTLEPMYENIIIIDHNGTNSDYWNTFPWMPDIIKQCQSEIGITNMSSLLKLMKLYHKQVAQSVKDCYSRPNRAAKLKRFMADHLFFFHMTFSDLKPPLEHSSYLAKMSDLMAMYMDMEIKASRTGTESLPKIASKLTSSLHIFFGRSQEQILDTVLKSKIITKNFWELSDLVFRRVLRDSPATPVHIFTYIRYILAFKMWKGIMKEGAERKKIAQLAAVKLEAPKGFKEKMAAGSLRDILPRVPKSRTDITTFLMQAKFPVRDKIKLFLKAVQDPKLQCALDRQTFNSIDAFPPLQEETESSALMNDIWSSMNVDSGIHDSFNRTDKVRKTKNMAKLKSEQLKKRRKKIEEVVEEVGEDDKPIPEEIAVDDEVNFIKLEVEEVPLKVKEYVEHTHFDIDEQATESTMEIAAEVELPADYSVEVETVKIETQPVYSKDTIDQTNWNKPDIQSYYNNVTYDYVEDGQKPGDYVVVGDQRTICIEQEVFEVLPEDNEHIEEVDVVTTDDKEIEVAPNIEVVPSAYLMEQRDVKTSIEETEIDKSLVKNMKLPTDTDTISVLHDYTIKSDHKMYEFQKKVYFYSSKLNIRTWLTFLSPLFRQQSRLKMYRCECVHCKSNLSVIRKNWKDVMNLIMVTSEKLDPDSLKGLDENGYTYENSLEDLKAIAEGEKGDIMYWETEIEELLKRIDETIKDDSESSNLPLKKRKALTYGNNGSMAKDDKPAMSYPSTPMMSIAEFALDTHKYYNVGVPLQQVPLQQKDVIPHSYPPPCTSHHLYPSVNNSVIVQTASKMVVAPGQQGLPPTKAPVPGAYTTTFLPVCQEQDCTKPSSKLRFKTPAELKEFKQFSGLSDSYQTFIPSEVPITRRQTRQKTNRQSKKRKRT